MDKTRKKHRCQKEALIISLAYLLAGAVWIYFSDDVLQLLEREAYRYFQTVKGIGYVLVTAVLLFFMLNKLIKKLKRHQESLDELVLERTAKLESIVTRLEDSETGKDKLLENLRRRLQFEQMIFDLAQNFFNADPENIDAELGAALRLIREYTDEDRICYIRYDWDNERVELMAQQNKQGIEPLARDWSQATFAGAQEMIAAHMRGENYCIEDTRALDTSFSFQLRQDGVQSFVSVPVVSHGRPRGFIGLYALNRKEEAFTLTGITIFTHMLKNFFDRSDKEEALRTNHTHMRVILESTRDGICLMDRDGNVIIANNAFAKQYGKALSDVVGYNIREIVLDQRYSMNALVFKKVLESGIPDVYHSVINNRYYEGTVYPVYNRGGQINGVAAFIADITRRTHNEREIFRTHRMFEDLIRLAPVGIYWKDMDGRYLGCNQLAAAQFGSTLEGMIGRTNKDYMDEETAAANIAHDRQVIESKEAALNHYTTIISRDGQIKTLRINKVPLMDKNGDVYALLGVSEDATEQRRKEQELIQAKQEASAASRAKSNFLSNMSHEIRTPLNAIIGLTHVASQSDSEDKIKDLLEKVNKSSKHLLSLVNDILDLSRIEAGKMSLSHSETDLVAAIEEVFSIVTQHADEKKQRLDLYIDNALPRYVWSDAIRFKQVLINLLFNAVKFTPEGGEIAVRAQTLKKLDGKAIARFSVTDNGIGIDADMVEKLFRPFEQEDSTSTREFKGAGLGLTISRSIVELMGGEIGAAGEKGKGSTFYFILPLETAEEKPASLDIPFESLNVLVVDDDQETCVYMTSLLSQFNVRSSWAGSGKAALSAVRRAKKPYNVVIVDWQMPEMNGIETVRQIREVAGPDTFVIMFSMFEWTEIEQQAKAAGVSMFLTKPVLPSRLFNTLSQICRRPDAPPGQTPYDVAFLKGKRILVAEDVKINRYILDELLKPTEAVIMTAEDGVQALEMYKAENGAFDIILMDIQMPVVDGVETTRRIRASGLPGAAEVPIIAMTANVFKEDVERMLTAGMNAHIGKPIDPDVLIKTLRAHIC